MTPVAGKYRHLDTGCLTKVHMIVWDPKGIPTRSMEIIKWYSPSQVPTAKHVSYPQLTATDLDTARVRTSLVRKKNAIKTTYFDILDDDVLLSHLTKKTDSVCEVCSHSVTRAYWSMIILSRAIYIGLQDTVVRPRDIRFRYMKSFSSLDELL